MTGSEKNKFTFPRKEKLKSQKLLSLLFTDGAAITKYPLKLVYLATSLPEPVKIQAAVAVPKKNFKKAVDRNRVKRLLREAYRLNKQPLFNNIDGSYAFLFLYLGKEMPSFELIEKGMRKIIDELLKYSKDAKVD
jgi:ribonuclease P protein component